MQYTKTKTKTILKLLVIKLHRIWACNTGPKFRWAVISCSTDRQFTTVLTPAINSYILGGRFWRICWSKNQPISFIHFVYFQIFQLHSYLYCIVKRLPFFNYPIILFLLNFYILKEIVSFSLFSVLVLF